MKGKESNCSDDSSEEKALKKTAAKVQPAKKEAAKASADKKESSSSDDSSDEGERSVYVNFEYKFTAVKRFPVVQIFTKCLKSTRYSFGQICCLTIL